MEQRQKSARIPGHIRIRPPSDPRYFQIREKLRIHRLHTVCEEARCPNTSECWSAGTATVMILGDTCTRFCKFCNVKTGNPRGQVDEDEPRRVAAQIAGSHLKYIVITCVDRDDLPDGGAWIFAETMRQVRRLDPSIKIESLISDYGGDRTALETLLEGAPDVLAHNLEVVREITGTIRDPRASYDQSLQVLSRAKEINPSLLTKSSLMVGLGESMEQLLEAIRDLRDNQVDVLTIGQYLRPSPKHHPVRRYYQPEEFRYMETASREMGFSYVASGPLVRSSYRASEVFLYGQLAKKAREM